jgi:TonB family protein
MTTPSKLISSVALVVAVASAVPATAETTTKNVCLIRNADASMTSSYPVDPPPFAKIAGLTGTVAVQVDLDEHGTAQAAKIVASSGLPILDDAARKAALIQSYKPQIRDCEAVSGSYRVTVDFDGR